MEVSAYEAGALGALVVFGLLYDRYVTAIERRPEGHRGYTAFLVVAGVAITVALMIPVIGVDAFNHIVVAFLCSGLPMIIGSVQRYMDARDRDAQRLQEITLEQLEHRDA